MEALFAHSYLILFGKLAVGGLLALAVPPFLEMERGFYKSTAVVYLFLGYTMTAGDAWLWLTYGDDGPVTLAVVAAWFVFCALFSVYVATLFIELPILRARAFPASVLAGFVALALTAAGYVPDNLGAAWALPYMFALMTGAAVAGAGATGMLLGHWYLIDTGLDLAPLLRMHAFCRASLILEITLVAGSVLVMWAWPGAPFEGAFDVTLGSRYAPLLVGRIATWGLALFLLVLIARTLEIPQTMAATGLFYIQALTVAVGQIIAQWLLFRTGLPM